MIQDMVKWGWKILLSLVCWVFLLSIRVDGETLFDKAHAVIVENPVVEAVDEELGELWYIIKETARATMENTGREDKKA